MKLTTWGGMLTALLIVAAVAVGGVTLRTMDGVGELRQRWHAFSDGAETKVILLQRLNAAVGYGGMIHQFKNYVLRQDADRVARVEQRVREALAIIADYRALPVSEVEVDALDRIEHMVQAYRKALDTAVALVAEGRSPSAVDKVVRIDDGPALAAIAVLTDHFVAAEATTRAALERTANATQALSRTGGVVAVGLLAVVVAVLGWFMAFRMGRPLRAMTRTMDRLAEGDTSVVVDAEGRGDELGDMARAVAVFRDNLLLIATLEAAAQGMVHSIAATAGQVQGAIGDQAASSNDQAAAVAQTSATLEEIRMSARNAAERARDLSAAAARTLAEGEAGAAEMADSVAAMSSIRDKVDTIARTMVAFNERNRRIADITETVGRLAQQSKMLAINASIEAAKAGESGKGFAVVAEQMGNLARQSEEATVQVRAILDEIQSTSGKAILATEDGAKQVDVGVALIQAAGRRIDNLSDVSRTTAEAAARIEETARQQSIAIAQVADATNDISSATRRFASSSGQIQAAIDDLVGAIGRLGRTRAR